MQEGKEIDEIIYLISEIICSELKKQNNKKK